MSEAYDNNNVFAKILRGELPCFRVHEDDHALAFMDVMPQTDGHVLVIPKKPARTLLDLDPADLAAMMPALHKVAHAAKTAMKADGITLHQFNEVAGGQAVFHVHFHILPRWDGVKLRPHSGIMAPKEQLAEWCERIKAAL